MRAVEEGGGRARGPPSPDAAVAAGSRGRSERERGRSTKERERERERWRDGEERRAKGRALWTVSMRSEPRRCLLLLLRGVWFGWQGELLDWRKKEKRKRRRESREMARCGSRGCRASSKTRRSLALGCARSECGRAVSASRGISIYVRGIISAAHAYCKKAHTPQTNAGAHKRCTRCGARSCPRALTCQAAIKAAQSPCHRTRPTLYFMITQGVAGTAGMCE